MVRSSRAMSALSLRSAAVLALHLPLLATAQTAVDQLPRVQQRELLQTEVSNSDIGAGYAQMLNFFIEPDISVSRLEADSADYNVFKLPMQYELEGDGSGPDLLLRATVSRATAKEDFSLVQSEVIDAQWKANSASVGAGLRWPVAEGLSLVLGGEFGISRLENDADYNGAIGELVLAPVLDGVLLNWDTNAWVASASAGLNYDWRWLDKYEVSLKGRYSYSHIASYSESRELPGFSEDTGTATVKLAMKHPWRGSLRGRPLFGVANIGGTAFTGSSRNALGFNHLYQFGYSIGVDISNDNPFLQDVSIGYQLSTGAEVDGYSILVGWTMK